MFKIAFLFLTVGNIFHPTYWQDFFKGHEDQYSIYIHAKNEITHDFFKPYALKKTVPTSWERTMQAQQLLLQTALQDEDNQIFIFLSESTIPLNSFDKVYRLLNTINSKMGKSIFSWEAIPDHYVFSDRYSHQLPKDIQFKCSQWIILNRKHAQMIAKDTIILPIITQQICDNEHYPATFLAYHKLLETEVLPVDKTFVDWNRRPNGEAHPYSFADLTIDNNLGILYTAIKNGYFFSRKFTKDCNLAPLDPYLAYRPLFRNIPYEPTPEQVTASITSTSIE